MKGQYGIKSRKKSRRKSHCRNVADFSWQLIGMITIIVILMTLAFGNSQQVASFASDSFLSKTFSEMIASF